MRSAGGGVGRRRRLGFARTQPRDAGVVAGKSGPQDLLKARQTRQHPGSGEDLPTGCAHTMSPRSSSCCMHSLFLAPERLPKQPGHIHGPELACPQDLRREVLQMGWHAVLPFCLGRAVPDRAASLRGSAAACGTQLIWILRTSAVAFVARRLKVQLRVRGRILGLAVAAQSSCARCATVTRFARWCSNDLRSFTASRRLHHGGRRIWLPSYSSLTETP